MNNIMMRSFAGAALSGLVVLSMTGGASAGPMSVSSRSAISAASPVQVEEARYYRRTIIALIGVIGIIVITGIIVATTPGLPLLERLSVSWGRPRRVLRVVAMMIITATPMVTIGPMAMGAGSAAAEREVSKRPCRRVLSAVSKSGNPGIGKGDRIGPAALPAAFLGQLS